MPQNPWYTPGWKPLIYFWDGGWLGFGRASGAVPEHAHHAVQISIGLDGPVRFAGADGAWQAYSAAAVLPNAPHSFDAVGSTVVMLFVEPESREGRWLRHSLRVPIAGFAPERLAEYRPRLLAFGEARPGAEEAARIITGVVHALCEGPPPLRGMDERIVRAMARMREEDGARLSLEEVAGTVFLSPSRFAHLFRDEVGLPFRRYLLWRKLKRAMEAFARGQTLSAAAHAAGFADSAHLTRTWNQMFGMSPTMMVGTAEFYEIPAPFELA